MKIEKLSVKGVYPNGIASREEAFQIITNYACGGGVRNVVFDTLKVEEETTKKITDDFDLIYFFPHDLIAEIEIAFEDSLDDDELFRTEIFDEKLSEIRDAVLGGWK